MTTGRPTIGPQIKVRLPRELIAELDAEAQRRAVTRSELVRVLLIDWWAEQT